MRTLELTEAGFRHDICSAVHPLGIGSPFFRQLNLARYGLTWIQPPLPLAHPLDRQRAVTLDRNMERMGEALGDFDAANGDVCLADRWRHGRSWLPICFRPGHCRRIPAP